MVNDRLISLALTTMRAGMIKQSRKSSASPLLSYIIGADTGEFCRGMTLFMSYFSRSTRTVYGYRYSDLNARILLFAYHALLRVKPNT